MARSFFNAKLLSALVADRVAAHSESRLWNCRARPVWSQNTQRRGLLESSEACLNRIGSLQIQIKTIKEPEHITVWLVGVRRRTMSLIEVRRGLFWLGRNFASPDQAFQRFVRLLGTWSWSPEYEKPSSEVGDRRRLRYRLRLGCLMLWYHEIICI